jgi:hypothetical protein
MALVLTTNDTTTNLLAVAPDEILSHVQLSTWAGQSDIAFIRLGWELDEYVSEEYFGQYFGVSSDDDRLTFSLNGVDFYATLEYGPMLLNHVGPGLWVRATAPDYATSEQVLSAVTVGPYSIDVVVDYYPPDEGDAAPTVYADSKSATVAQKFQSLGQELTIMEYRPINYGESSEYFFRPTPAQICYPYGDYWESTAWRVKGFVGNREVLTDAVFKTAGQEMQFADEEGILLPATFDGFNPRIVTALEPFGQVTPDTMGYRQTVWTCIRSNGEEYHLRNISRQHYYTGSFLFYYATLTLVQQPTPQSPDGYLPWNIIVTDSGKPAVYIRGYEV